MNIVIIENNNFYRESLKVALNQIDDFNISFDTDNLNSFFQIVDSFDCHIILLDFTFYQSENIRKILQLLPNAKVLVLSNYTENYFLEPQIDGISFSFIPKCSTKNVFEQKIKESLNTSAYSKLQIN
jgi:DNA-binding NarL/FixJ family response regulator